ncbi:MAG TPA: neutral zinc metallopeptidase [Ignavibacteriales bacterium]|jgi:predicted metalloprotease|nr:neutral zinc metallopeptidase [Ignavibacteriales bacterium]
MRWRGLRQSSNVEDRRGGGTSRRFVGGGIGTLVIALIIWLLGGNPGEIFNILSPGGGEQTTTNYQESAEENELKQFVSVVLAETEDAWTKIFREKGSDYRKPKLVLYTNSVQSACGFSSAAVGPFYCPGDEKLYLDLSFYDELQKRFHAPGDFAMAYVVAHEVGHHVQNLLGISEKVAALRRRLSEEEYNKFSVRLELQADYFAGVWAHYADRTKQIVEQGDIDEALRAASAVGDDNIQKQSQGYVVPESFTHGTSEQRKKWFYKGYQSGTLEGGDTFSADNP